MRKIGLQSKIILISLPLIVGGILGVGLWSFNQSRDSLYDYTYRHLHLTLESYIHEHLVFRNNLLKRNGLDEIPSYVSSYQMEALDLAPEPIFVFSEEGKLVFASSSFDKSSLESVWAKLVMEGSKSESDFNQGVVNEGEYHHIYVSQTFQPWGWVVFYGIPDNEINASVKNILESTFTIAGLFALGAILMVIVLSRHFIIKPLVMLKTAAAQIAHQQSSHQIPIQSWDELGALARSIEVMSVSIETYREDLEDQVLKRTKELEEAMYRMKETQAQLVQSEKMAGLGVLLAGVAHEINNPTSYVNNGANNLGARIDKLEEFIYRLAGDEVPPAIRKAIHEKFSPLRTNLEAIQEGTERIKTIVNDLRTFSRLEESEQQIVSIVEGLQATLTLVRANFKHQVEFLTDYRADPLLRCWPAQLNQVFMNLGVNACQAIKSRQKKSMDPFQGQLKVSTFLQGNYFLIRFEDNGCGIPEEIRQHIFEPFYTTKPAGEGTGLGLSITFNIIEQHRGSINVESQVDQGTIFTIYLPI